MGFFLRALFFAAGAGFIIDDHIASESELSEIYGRLIEEKGLTEVCVKKSWDCQRLFG